MKTSFGHLIWIDLEMTGLDPQRDEIIEIATIVTDSELNILAEGPVIAIHQSHEIMDNLDDWNRRHHSASGLIERVKASSISLAQAETQTIEFLSKYLEAGKSPMCGNSICQDRRFLARHMPQLEKFFHYRNLDVSSLKELVARWYPQHQYHKKNTHQALADIQESIAELKYYRQHVFKTP